MSDSYRNQDDVFGESVDSTGHSMSGYYNLIYKMYRITAEEYRQALRVLHNHPNNANSIKHIIARDTSERTNTDSI